MAWLTAKCVLHFLIVCLDGSKRKLSKCRKHKERRRRMPLCPNCTYWTSSLATRSCHTCSLWFRRATRSSSRRSSRVNKAPRTSSNLATFMPTRAYTTSRFLTRKTSSTLSSTRWKAMTRSARSLRHWLRSRTRPIKPPWISSNEAKKTVMCSYNPSYQPRRNSSCHPFPHRKISGRLKISWWARRSYVSRAVLVGCQVTVRLGISPLTAPAWKWVTSAIHIRSWAGHHTPSVRIGTWQRTLISIRWLPSRNKCKKASKWPAN